MVDLLWFSILGLVVLFVLFALGLEVAFTLGLLGALGLYFYTGGTLGLSAMGPIAFTNSNSFVLTAIPLFILLGAFL
ncbi:MAG: C4-dicarboxylate ABC transporter permease, partial [Chloroflexi bacterium]|nr:C4-dicarboxylate ABC transporter permease [Chloroflexota bacterium]